MASQLDALKQHSVIVADTGDIDAIARYRPIVDEAIGPAASRPRWTRA